MSILFQTAISPLRRDRRPIDGTLQVVTSPKS